MALMQRMYSPTRGQVLLDGYNLRQINAQYLHRVIVSVGQEPTLFSFTIRENVRSFVFLKLYIYLNSL